MSSPKFRVAVCGGGIGGLISAIAISKFSSQNKDIHIDLYEGAQAFFEIGAGVTTFRRPWLILKDIGLETELRSITKVPIEEDKAALVWQVRRSDRPEGLPFYDLYMPGGNASFYRVELQNALVKTLDPDTTKTHFAKRMVSYTLPPPSEPTSPITLHFEDGSVATCDVLLGADGIHSVTRRTLLNLAANDAEKNGSEDSQKTADALRGFIEPIWSGAMIYRGLIPREKLEKLNPNHSALTTSQLYTGQGQFTVAYLVSNGRLLNIAAIRIYAEKEGSPVEGDMIREAPQEELLALFENWEDEVKQLCQCIEKPSRWAVRALNSLPIFTHDRVALLGDAAHAMTPFQGSGAGQAIEDAYILAALLAHPSTTLSTLPTALKVYESIRLPFANGVQKASRNNGLLTSFQHPRTCNIDLSGTKEEQIEKLNGVMDLMIQDWKWAWTTDPIATRDEAIRTLEQRLAAH